MRVFFFNRCSKYIVRLHKNSSPNVKIWEIPWLQARPVSIGLVIFFVAFLPLNRTEDHLSYIGIDDLNKSIISAPNRAKALLSADHWKTQWNQTLPLAQIGLMYLVECSRENCRKAFALKPKPFLNIKTSKLKLQRRDWFWLPFLCAVERKSFSITFEWERIIVNPFLLWNCFNSDNIEKRSAIFSARETSHFWMDVRVFFFFQLAVQTLSLWNYTKNTNENFIILEWSRPMKSLIILFFFIVKSPTFVP